MIVRDVELTQPIEAIDGSAQAASLLVRRHGEPVGLMTLEVPGGGLDGAAIAAEVNARLGSVIARRHAATSEAQTRRARAIASGPEIIAVVCTRNRASSLAHTLDSLLAQDYPRVRVLVVDNAPTGDDTAATVADAARRGDVDYLLAPEPGLSRARNAAIAARPGAYLAWIDDDAVADPHWLTEMAAAVLENPDAAVICGSVAPAELVTPAQRLFEEFGGLVKHRGFEPARFTRDGRQSPLYPLPPFGAGVNMMTAPGVLERIGGFDPALGAGSPAAGAEDTLAFTQILLDGGVICYHPAALVRHFHRRDMTGLRRQLHGYGTGVTAFYTALLLRRPSSLFGLAALAPRAAWDVVSARGRRHRDLSADFPRELKNIGRRGMLGGPGAYLRGRLALARLARPHPTQPHPAQPSRRAQAELSARPQTGVEPELSGPPDLQAVPERRA